MNKFIFVRIISCESILIAIVRKVKIKSNISGEKFNRSSKSLCFDLSFLASAEYLSRRSSIPILKSTDNNWHTPIKTKIIELMSFSSVKYIRNMAPSVVNIPINLKIIAVIIFFSSLGRRVLKVDQCRNH